MRRIDYRDHIRQTMSIISVSDQACIEINGLGGEHELCVKIKGPTEDLTVCCDSIVIHGLNAENKE